MSGPRVRFAPSPTGYFHVGSARTSLFNWLFARRHGGTFILRIEDTDTERNREEWVEGILSAMAWLGMDPDEGPYRQSERAGRYAAALDALWEGGHLYACECTRAQVEDRTRGNQTPGYDGYCRDRGLGREGRALRFRVPDEGATVVSDLVRGEVRFPHAAMEDFVVAKSSGQPLFVLANVVDDRDMAISHVIRGEDLLPSGPKGILLWRALDAVGVSAGGAGAVPGAVAGAGAGADREGAPPEHPLPAFAHLPMLVNERRQKLSKRRDPVAVEMYRDQGFLPEAFRNYLALLGWSPPGGAEKVDVGTLIGAFRLEEVHHAPAFFDVQKLTHLNGEYLRELPLDRFVAACRPWVAPRAGEWAPASGGPPWPPERFDDATFAAIAPMVQERVATLGEVPGMVDFLFLEDPALDEASWAKAVVGDPDAGGILQAAAAAYRTCEWSPEALHRVTGELAEAAGRRLAKAQAPIRVAVTGRSVGPPLFESLFLLGRDEVLRRIGAALRRLGRQPPEGTAG
ncbi:MAG TPA: glutamate--tRNA ligase family protein [Acidimicrobiales bacterium]|nr:glutamate--tRNA ligase family protein [Acidimicrobiales bacterium]